jgi:hypothetical protein
VGNTDAEGRMVMCDLLAQAREEAVAAKSSIPTRLFTVATLTGSCLETVSSLTQLGAPFRTCCLFGWSVLDCSVKGACLAQCGK